jgi:hypothetical protein
MDAIQAAGEQLFNDYPDAIAPLCSRWLAESSIYSEV